MTIDRGTEISSENILPEDVVTNSELASDGSTSYHTGSITSTVSSSKVVTLVNGQLGDKEAEGLDTLVIAGNAAAGSYTINEVLTENTCSVNEAIADSTGGTFSLYRKTGEERVGVNKSRFSFLKNASSSLLNKILDYIDTHNHNNTNSAFIPSQNVSLSTANNPTLITSLREAITHIWSSGVIEGGDITDNGDGTISLSAGEALLRESASQDGLLSVYKFNAQVNLAITANDVSYIYIDRNGGTPVFLSASSLSGINGLDSSIAYIIGRDGTKLAIVDLRFQNVDMGRKIGQSRYDIRKYDHAGGCMIASSGLNISITAGKFYYGVSEILHALFDTSLSGTSLDRVYQLFYNKASWASLTLQKTINNSQYDNAGTLTSLGTSNYRVDYVYVVFDSVSPIEAQMVLVMGDYQYPDLPSAKASQPPTSVPPSIDGVSIMIGRVFVQQGASSVTVESAFGVVFIGNVATPSSFSQLVSFFDTSGANPYITVADVTYKTIAYYPYVGKNVQNLSIMKAVFWRLSGSGTVAMRIYNAATAQVIAEVTDITSELGILSLGAVANLPALETILDIQVKTSSSNTKGAISSLIFRG